MLANTENVYISFKAGVRALIDWAASVPLYKLTLVTPLDISRSRIILTTCNYHYRAREVMLEVADKM